MEVTPTPIINNDWGRLQAWAGGALGETEERWQNADNGDLDSIHLTFRRLVGVLLRCQSPAVAMKAVEYMEQIPCCERSGWQVKGRWCTTQQEVNLWEGVIYTAESRHQDGDQLDQT